MIRNYSITIRSFLLLHKTVWYKRSAGLGYSLFFVENVSMFARLQSLFSRCCPALCLCLGAGFVSFPFIFLSNLLQVSFRSVRWQDILFCNFWFKRWLVRIANVYGFRDELIDFYLLYFYFYLKCKSHNFLNNS